MSDYDKKWYSSLKKPLLTPPSYVFGIVWPILYILISISAYIVWKNEKCFPYQNLGKLLKTQQNAIFSNRV